MLDILGREIEQGDLVVIKPTGRHSSGLDIGVFYGKSVRFKNGKTATYNQFFKVCNPSGDELELKSDILNQIKIEEDKKKERSIPIKDLEIGRLYENKNGSKEFYLGKEKYKHMFQPKNEDVWKSKNWRDKPEEGFLCLSYYSFNKCNTYDYNTFQWIKARISKPQYVRALDEKIEIKSNSIAFEENINGWNYRLKIELL